MSAAQPAQHLQTVDVGQHHVQHDQVGAEVPGGGDGRGAVAGGADVPALVPQGQADQLGQGLLVVDHQDPDRPAVGPAQGGAVGRGGGAGQWARSGHATDPGRLAV